MPIYDFTCATGHRSEHLVPNHDSPAPSCPFCGEDTRRRPAACALGGTASPGLSREEMPQSWRGTYSANPEYVTTMRRRWENRSKLEERYPELRGDTRPILSHEGRYEGAPLRLGDTPLTQANPSEGHLHGGSHTHPH
jgi:putative FmdB family regulatory protein